MKRVLQTALLGSVLVAHSMAIAAEDYPGNKPIKIIAAFSAGSATDTSARIIAEELRNDLGATVLVENKPGAQGVIGTEYAVKSPGDGYTLTISSSSLNSINPGLIKNLPYDATKDFTHITRLTTMPALLLVKHDSDIKTVAQLVERGKEKKLNFGYGSPGGQVAAEAFNRIAGIQSLGVPYKSQPQALTDLAGGQIDYVVGDLSVATTLMKGEKIRALAVSTDDRLPEWRDVPTFAESGFKPFDLVFWVGLAGPAGIPPEVAQRLNVSVNKALAKPEIRERFMNMGMEVAPNSVEAQQEFVRSQLKSWAARMQEANIKPE
jgi:tripartite-type tricarboxylate transporter receptor subunit TctC